ncbi:MAG: UDP-N-acetylmuramoyl-tripeptide--D-alanyl-D-alanine ligase, partial [Verrucomicrobiota bacterium]
MPELMETRCLKYVAESCDGQIINGADDCSIHRICTDSRKVREGDLFVALTGDHFDGHDYVVDSGRNGAAAALVERGKGRAARQLPLVLVADTRVALGKLASQYRRDFNLPIVIVGGSNGKTTTKELIASVLRQRFNTLASEASFNNDIGVPLTLLSLEDAHQIGVLEVGTNHPGELAPLVRMIQPQFGVVTTIGREHLEFFGNLAAVAQEEGWLAELLPAEGKLFIGGDGHWCDTVVQRACASIIRLGTAETNDWRATRIRVDGLGTTFDVKSPMPPLNGCYRINLLGR